MYYTQWSCCCCGSGCGCDVWPATEHLKYQHGFPGNWKGILKIWIQFRWFSVGFPPKLYDWLSFNFFNLWRVNNRTSFILFFAPSLKFSEESEEKNISASGKWKRDPSRSPCHSPLNKGNLPSKIPWKFPVQFGLRIEKVWNFPESGPVKVDEDLCCCGGFVVLHRKIARVKSLPGKMGKNTKGNHLAAWLFNGFPCLYWFWMVTMPEKRSGFGWVSSKFSLYSFGCLQVAMTLESSSLGEKHERKGGGNPSGSWRIGWWWFVQKKDVGILEMWIKRRFSVWDEASHDEPIHLLLLDAALSADMNHSLSAASAK